MDEFQDVYKKMQEFVREASGGRFRHFEDTRVVQQDAMGIQKADLLEIDSDEEFVKNCFYKLLGRNPSNRDVGGYSNELTKGRSTRAELIEKFLDSPEYKKKAVEVRFL